MQSPFFVGIESRHAGEAVYQEFLVQGREIREEKE
jgi:hypothetical protein